MTKTKKKRFALVIALIGYIVWTQTYSFNVDKAVSYLTENGQDKSTHRCAWYTMRALQEGGCPAIILPAQWYRYFMPLVQFEEVHQDGYVPLKGDVVVFERPAWRSWKRISQWWGHIAMYNGEQWISDFKQEKMSPYKKAVPYRIYRRKKLGLSSNENETLKEGDIVFQTSTSQQAPFIIAATHSPWSHCGIIIEKADGLYVLEAISTVSLTPYDQWKKRGKGKRVGVKRYTEEPVKIKYGKYLGKPYDLAFKFNNGKWYCSELVYDIYKIQLGMELCKPRPVSDYSIAGSEKLMKKRGIDKNQLVVAPSDLYDSKLLK